MSSDYVISEVTVTGSFKNWSDPTRDHPQGMSGGSEVAFTAVPPSGESGWKVSEAEVIGFELRMKIHVMLMADAQMRGIQLPASAHHALVSYQEKVKVLKGGKNGEVKYQDVEVPSPSPSMVVDEYIKETSI